MQFSIICVYRINVKIHMDLMVMQELEKNVYQIVKIYVVKLMSNVLLLLFLVYKKRNKNNNDDMEKKTKIKNKSIIYYMRRNKTLLRMVLSFFVVVVLLFFCIFLELNCNLSFFNQWNINWIIHLT